MVTILDDRHQLNVVQRLREKGGALVAERWGGGAQLVLQKCDRPRK